MSVAFANGVKAVAIGANDPIDVLGLGNNCMRSGNGEVYELALPLSYLL
jgi:hypothetical protein